MGLCRWVNCMRDYAKTVQPQLYKWELNNARIQHVQAKVETLQQEIAQM